VYPNVEAKFTPVRERSSIVDTVTDASKTSQILLGLASLVQFWQRKKFNFSYLSGRYFNCHL